LSVKEAVGIKQSMDDLLFDVISYRA